MPPLITALVRTLTSMLLGATLTALANLLRREMGVELVVDDATKATLVAGVTAFVSMLWYATFATLERRWPAFGVFLGWPTMPRYGDEETPQMPAEVRSELEAWRSPRRDDSLP